MAFIAWHFIGNKSRSWLDIKEPMSFGGNKPDLDEDESSYIGQPLAA